MEEIKLEGVDVDVGVVRIIKTRGDILIISQRGITHLIKESSQNKKVAKSFKINLQKAMKIYVLGVE